MLISVMRVNEYPRHFHGGSHHVITQTQTQTTPSPETTTVTPERRQRKLPQPSPSRQHRQRPNPPATAEPPGCRTTAKGHSFADRVGQKKWSPRPTRSASPKTTLPASASSRASRTGRWPSSSATAVPEDKPSQAVIDRMKEAGYRWNPADRVWTHPVRPDSAMSTRIEAEKLYQEVRQMIRAGEGYRDRAGSPF